MSRQTERDGEAAPQPPLPPPQAAPLAWIAGLDWRLLDDLQLMVLNLTDMLTYDVVVGFK